MRMLRLRDALSAVRDLDVAAMAIEQPGLLLFDGDWDAEVPRVWNAVERALGPDVRLARLADACPCARHRPATIHDHGGGPFPRMRSPRLGAPPVKWVRGADPTTGSASSPAAWAVSGVPSHHGVLRHEDRRGHYARRVPTGKRVQGQNKQLRPQTSSEPRWRAARPPRPVTRAASAREGREDREISVDDAGARDGSR